MAAKRIRAQQSARVKADAIARKARRTRVGMAISRMRKRGIPHKQAVAMALSMESRGRLGPRGGYISSGMEKRRNVVVKTRPRGRSPAGKVWDYDAGRWRSLHTRRPNPVIRRTKVSDKRPADRPSRPRRNIAMKNYNEQSVLALSRADIAKMIEDQKKALADKVAVKTVVYPNGKSGNALVAKRDLPAGFSIKYYGLPADAKEMNRWKSIQRKQTHSLQVDSNLAVRGKFRLNGTEYVSLGATMTHSVDSNVYVRADRSEFPELVTVRRIDKGEELMLDYGTSYFKVPRDFKRRS